MKLLFPLIGCVLLLIAGFSYGEPKKLFTVSGLSAPESAVYDPDLDCYFVSNINGDGTAHDNNGFISRLQIDGTIAQLKFIEGGKNGVTLNAPKGITILHNFLWVSDIDSIRAYDKKTGKTKFNVDLSSLGAIFLNDITAGPNDDIFVTDTALRFDQSGNASHSGVDRVFRIDRNGKATIAAEGNWLEGPDGILWDPHRKSFVIVCLNGKDILSWSGDVSPGKVIATGAGGFDGIVQLSANRYLVSSLDTSSIYLFENSTAKAIISGVENPADISWDSKRNRLLVPSFSLNQLQIWQL